MRLNFAIVGPEEAETVHRLLYATYYPGEPLISHLGLCTGPHSIAELDTAVEKRLAKNLTLSVQPSSLIPWPSSHRTPGWPMTTPAGRWAPP